MNAIEITGKSLDDAKSIAARQLGVEVDQLDVEVLEQSKGLFGKTNFKIKASVKGGAAPAKAEEKPASKASKPAPAPAPEAEEEAPAPAAAPEREAKPTRGGRGRGGKTAKTAEPESAPEASAAEPEATVSNGEETSERADAVATEEDGKRMLELVNEMLKKGDLDVQARVGSLSGRYVSIELNGKDLSYLIAKNGEGLNGFQSLLNIIWNHRSPNGIRATIDGDHYREERERVLEQMAHQVAEQVKERGEEAVLRPLPAFERRIIHKVLSEIEGIITYSEGEDPERRVVIAPAE